MTQVSTLRTGGIAASREYQDLPAWQKAITLAERAYQLSEGFPAREHAGLAADLRAAATRVASHIAAASAKQNEQGILNSYHDAQAASAELATLVTLSERLGYLSADDATAFTTERDEVNRLVIGLKHGMKVEAKDEKRAARETAERDREHTERNTRPDRKPRGDFGDRPPRREYSDKPRSSDRGEYKPRAPRGDGDYKPRAPRGEGDYKPRAPRGEGEYKPRAPRGEGEYKPRAPRADGEFKPRGEYKPRDGGDRKPYGDKPRGERKPYGDKPRSGGTGGPRKPYRKD